MIYNSNNLPVTMTFIHDVMESKINPQKYD